MLTLTTILVVLVYLFLSGCTSIYMEDNGYGQPWCLLGGVFFVVVAPIMLLSHCKQPWNKI